MDVAPPSSPSPLAALVAAPLAATVALAAMAGGLVAQAGVSRHVPVTSTSALVLVAAFPLLARAATWRGGPRGAVVAALTVVPTAAVFFLAAAWSLTEPLVASHFRCGTADAGLVLVLPPALFIVTLAGGAVGVGCYGREHRSWDRALRTVAWLAVVLATMVAARATTRALHHPQPEAYVHSLPVVGRVAARRADQPGLFALHGRETVFTADETVVAGVRIQRRCAGPAGATGSAAIPGLSCDWQLARDTGRPLALTPASWEGRPFSPDASFVVRHDTAHELWVLASTDGTDARPFRDGTFEPVDITVRGVAGGLGTPWGWVVGGWVGVLVALLSLARSDAGPKTFTGRWHEGIHEGRGVIRFADGTAPTRVPIGSDVPVGPVVVLPITDARAAGYRDDGAPVPLRVLPGTVASVGEALRAPGVARAALALAAVAVTQAPLLAAWIQGLVW